MAGAAGEQVRVQGDLGIAVAFQQRARAVLDARVTGTEPGEPWRILLLPQPEKICLQFSIDALGFISRSLRAGRGAQRPGQVAARGTAPGTPVDADDLLASADRAALLTVTRHTTEGSAETAENTTDLVLARKHDRLHVLARDPSDRSRLVPVPKDGKEMPDRLTELLT